MKPQKKAELVAHLEVLFASSIRCSMPGSLMANRLKAINPLFKQLINEIDAKELAMARKSLLKAPTKAEEPKIRKGNLVKMFYHDSRKWVDGRIVEVINEGEQFAVELTKGHDKGRIIHCDPDEVK